MASMTGSRGEAESIMRAQMSTTRMHLRSSCHRCGGLMVTEFCADLLSSMRELEFLASRCVQCGEVIDPVILKNRERQQEIMTGKDTKVAAQRNGCQVAA